MTPDEKISPSVARLAAQQLNAEADQVTVTQLTGDASTRAYYRARAMESSLVISIYSEPFDESDSAMARLERMEAASPAARLTFANDPCAHIEATRLFLEAGLPVPQILAVSGRDRAMLFEDVGDVRLQDWLSDHSPAETASAYERAIELLVKIQEASGLAAGSDYVARHLAFDEPKLRWELGFFFANYFTRYLGLKMDSAMANGVQQDFRAICSELAARPRVLTHRDYHARNLMMTGGAMFIIDHQDARMGPASYDLASLVNDPYTSLGGELSASLIERFIEMKARSSEPLASTGEFRAELELMNVQRMLKAVGTYSYQAAALDNLTYVDYIEPAIERALVSISALGRFERLRELLEKTREMK
ncbi:MAG TPA: phosphotransferase [Blastocatellia bacterium]|jgi:aminoglycoside/choline kinase family phosphotransferase|nr:phosphotransferase [Blastocatellia bacterium]